MEQKGEVADTFSQAILDLAEQVEGTISITKKTNGVMISIFMPYTEKPKRRTLPAKQFESVDMQFAQGLHTIIKATNPRIQIKYSGEQWAHEFYQLRQHYEPQYIQDVIHHVYMNKEDNFWVNKILSARKFREKFETVAAQMSNKRKGWV